MKVWTQKLSAIQRIIRWLAEFASNRIQLQAILIQSDVLTTQLLMILLWWGSILMTLPVVVWHCLLWFRYNLSIYLTYCHPLGHTHLRYHSALWVLCQVGQIFVLMHRQPAKTNTHTDFQTKQLFIAIDKEYQNNLLISPWKCMLWVLIRNWGILVSDHNTSHHENIPI